MDCFLVPKERVMHLENTGNILCDAFIAECVAFSESLDAASCTAAPFYSKNGHMAEGAVSEYVFDTFTACVIYNTVCGGAKSVLEMRISFSSEPEIDFSLYDLLYLLNENNFSCYIFPYVESEQRMRACLGVLHGALLAYRTQISAIGDDKRLRERAIARKKREMNRYFHTDIFAEQDMSDELFILQKSWYREWYISRFCAGWYKDYVTGNYEVAAKSFAKYENKSDYEIRLYRFIKTLASGVEYTPVPNECNTYILGKKVFSGKKRRARLISCLVLFIPLYLAYLALFALSYHVIYRSALICSSFIGAQMLILPLIAALVSDIFLSDITYRYFEKKNKKGSASEKAADIHTADETRVSRMNFHFVTLVCIAAVIFSAKWGIAVYPSGIVDNRSFAPGVSEKFTDVVSAKESGDGYELAFADGNTFECPKNITEKYILPHINIKKTP